MWSFSKTKNHVSVSTHLVPHVGEAEVLLLVSELEVTEEAPQKQSSCTVRRGRKANKARNISEVGESLHKHVQRYKPRPSLEKRKRKLENTKWLEFHSQLCEIIRLTITHACTQTRLAHRKNILYIFSKEPQISFGVSRSPTCLATPKHAEATLSATTNHTLHQKIIRRQTTERGKKR